MHLTDNVTIDKVDITSIPNWLQGQNLVICWKTGLNFILI